MAKRSDGTPKTNAMRLLEAAGIAFETRSYEVDENDLSAPTVAAKIGFDVEQVFKTLLVLAGDEYLFAVIPGNYELDRKALAKLSGHRSVEMAPLKELEKLTGYIRGGVTVPGAKKAYRVFVDETVELHEVISVSAGMRGLQLIVKPADYLRLTEGVVGEISQPAS